MCSKSLTDVSGEDIKFGKRNAVDDLSVINFSKIPHLKIVQAKALIFRNFRE